MDQLVLLPQDLLCHQCHQKARTFKFKSPGLRCKNCSTVKLLTEQPLDFNGFLSLYGFQKAGAQNTDRDKLLTQAHSSSERLLCEKALKKTSTKEQTPGHSFVSLMLLVYAPHFRGSSGLWIYKTSGPSVTGLRTTGAGQLIAWNQLLVFTSSPHSTL